MRTFDSLAAMKACLPDGACEPTAQVLASVRDYIMGSIEDASLTALFGWPVYLVERAEDLCAILSFDVVNGQRVSLADAASASFDVAEWVDNGRFARFVTIEAADGGPQYLVPHAIAAQVSSVRESIEKQSAGAS